MDTEYERTWRPGSIISQEHITLMPYSDPDVLEAVLDQVLAPYARILPRPTLAKMREEMREYAVSHPFPAAHLRQLSPEDVQASHVTTTGASEGSPELKSPPRRVNGGRRGYQ